MIPYAWQLLLKAVNYKHRQLIILFPLNLKKFGLENFKYNLWFLHQLRLIKLCTCLIASNYKKIYLPRELMGKIK